MNKCEKCGKEYEGEQCGKCFPPSLSHDDPAPPPEAAEPPAASDPPPPAAPAGDPLRATFDEIFQNLPKSEPHVIAQLRQEENARVKDALRFRRMKDRKGFYFDPEICKTTPDGSPVFTRTGLFDLRREKKRTDLKKKFTPPADTPAEVAADLEAEGDIIPDALGSMPDLRAAAARASAEEMDAVYWSVMAMVAPKTTPAVKPHVSPAAVAAMARGFEQMANVPALHWSVSVGMIYAGATWAILNSAEAAPRVLSWKEKVGLWWHRRKNRRSGARAVAAEGE